MEKDGIIVTDSFEKAEKLREQYEWVYSEPDEKWLIPDVNQFFSISSCKQNNANKQSERTSDRPRAAGVAVSEIQGVAEIQGDAEIQGVTEIQGVAKIQALSKNMAGSDIEQATPHISPPVQKSLELDGVFFDFTDVTLAIDSIPHGASPGPDGVPPSLLKKSKVNIARMLLVIWQDSYDTGNIPDILKLALVSPIHKGGSRAEPSQYRPISLTSHIIKVMERMLRKQIVGFLEINEKMDPNQHGSRGKRSCLSQLLEHHLEILDMLERGENVDLVYLDFAKAFDKCDINLLLHKTKALGITGKVGRWIHSFLIQRKQNIIVNGTKSKDSNVLSGVPQGTVLGPLLFLIYIADIGEKFTSTIKVYVDDTKLKKSIKTETDVEHLQEDLETLYTWAEENNMKFNGTKFQVLRLGNNSDLKDDTVYFTENMSNIIEQFETIKDLGVVMNDQATFKNHIEKALKKAR